MLWRNTPYTWGFLAKFFHWGIVLLLCGLIPIGFYMTNLPNDNVAVKFQLYQIHKSVGFVVGALMLVRLGWRTLNLTPKLPSSMGLLERFLAQGVHGFLYLILLALPLSGWIMVSASPLGIPTVWFGLVTIPPIVSPDPGLYDLAKSLHNGLVLLLLGVMFLHIMGAVYHHFVRRDDVLLRMLPGRRLKS